MAKNNLSREVLPPNWAMPERAQSFSKFYIFYVFTYFTYLRTLRALTLKELYPGWIFRLYVDNIEMKREAKQQLCQISCSSDM